MCWNITSILKWKQYLTHLCISENSKLLYIKKVKDIPIKGHEASLEDVDAWIHI